MEKKKFNPNSLVVILFELAVGVLLILNPDMFTRAIILVAGVVLAIVGIINIISYFKTEAEVAAQGQKLVMGLDKVQTTVDMLRLKRGMWVFPVIGAVVSIVCAIIIIVNPFTAVNIVWTFIGVTLLFEAAFDIMTMVTKNKVKKEKTVTAETTEKTE